MKEQGFERDKDRRTWRKPLDAAHLVLNIQAARGNDSIEARFFVNLGVSHPALRRLVYDQDPPPAPKEYQCDLRARLDEVTTDAPKSWAIGFLENKTTLGKILADCVAAHGLPWLEDNADLEQVALNYEARQTDFAFENLRGPTALYLALGRKDAAQAAYARLLQDCNPVALDNMRAWGRAHGLTP